MSSCNSALVAPKVLHINKRAFLAAFSRCGSISQAAKRAKVDRRTHYNWLRQDPGYREAFQHATIEAGDALEDKLSEMAHAGNVTAAIFLLKGIRPEKYKDRRPIELDLKDWDGDVSKLSDEQFAKFCETIAERARKAGVLEERNAGALEAGAQVVDAVSEEILGESERGDVSDSEG